MKQIVLIMLLAIFATSLSAQKAVRKSIRKGNKAFKEQRYSTAVADYTEAMEGDASSKEASFNLANTYYKQHLYDEALEEYKHYLTLESEAPEKMSAGWSNMGNTFLKKKADEKNQMQAQGQGGTAQQQQVDNLKMSMEAYKNALRLNPQDDETRENLAIVQKMINDQESGESEDDNKDDQNKDNKDDKKDQQDKKEEDKKEEPKDQQQNENQMSEENMQQILDAIEQDERETQERVNQLKADERKKKSERNRQQDKDW